VIHHIFIIWVKSNKESLHQVPEAMPEKTLWEFSAPSIKNIRTWPTLQVNHEFELKASLINMVQANPFSGKVHEDASTHLQNFLEIGTAISIKNIPIDMILFRFIPILTNGRAR
jgi:hypothetical protein